MQTYELDLAQEECLINAPITPDASSADEEEISLEELEYAFSYSEPR